MRDAPAKLVPGCPASRILSSLRLARGRLRARPLCLRHRAPWRTSWAEAARIRERDRRRKAEASGAKNLATETMRRGGLAAAAFEPRPPQQASGGDAVPRLADFDPNPGRTRRGAGALWVRDTAPGWIKSSKIVADRHLCEALRKIDLGQINVQFRRGRLRSLGLCGSKVLADAFRIAR